MARLHMNFGAGETSALVSGVDDELPSASLAALDVIASPDYMDVTLDPLAEHGQPEVVGLIVHADGSTTATMMRGKWGTTAREHPAGTKWRHGTYAADLDGLGIFFNVKAFGAVGDGIINDTAAIQAAVDAAIAAGGGVVFFPAGTYLLTASIMGGNGVGFMGLGWADIDYFGSQQVATLLADGVGVLAGAPIIDISNTSRPSVVGLSLRQADLTGANTTYGIADLTGNASEARIEQCYLQRFGRDGIHISGNVTHIYNNGMRNVLGDGIHLTGHDNIVAYNDMGGGNTPAPNLATSGRGIYMTGTNNLVFGNECFLQVSGIVLDTGAEGNRVLGNRCEKNTDYGIVVEHDGIGNLIEGNHCFQNGAANIAVLGGDDGLGTARANTVVGNFCMRYPGLGEGTNPPIGILIEQPRCKVTANQLYRNIQGIVVNGVDFCQITDNTIDSHDHEAIVLTDASDCQVANNFVGRGGQSANNTYDAISVDATSHRNTIEHNKTRHEGTGNKYRHACAITAGAEDNVVIGNDFRNTINNTAASDIVSDAGTATIVRDNLPYATRSGFDPRSVRADGSTGSWVGTPDDASLDVTGDIDIRVAAGLANWTGPATIQNLLDKWVAAGNQRAWNFAVLTNGKLQLQWTADGATTITIQSTTALTFSPWDLRAVRVTLDVDDGAGNNVVTFYTKAINRKAAAADLAYDASGWAVLGAAVTTAGTTSIFSSNAELRGCGDFNPSTGRFVAFVVKDGINGTVVADPDFAAIGLTDNTIDDATGKTWTLNGSIHPEVA